MNTDPNENQFNRREVLSDIRSHLKFHLAPRDDSVVVDLCFPNGRASNAGLIQGDLITGVDGGPVSGRNAFLQLMGTRDLRERVTFQVARGNVLLDIVIEPSVEGPSSDFNLKVKGPSSDFNLKVKDPIPPVNRSTTAADIAGAIGVANFFVGAAAFYFVAGLIGSFVVAYNSVHTTYLGKTISIPGSGLHFVEVFAICFFLVCLFSAMLAFFGYVLKLLVELVRRLSN